MGRDGERIRDLERTVGTLRTLINSLVETVGLVQINDCTRMRGWPALSQVNRFLNQNQSPLILHQHLDLFWMRLDLMMVDLVVDEPVVDPSHIVLNQPNGFHQAVDQCP